MESKCIYCEEKFNKLSNSHFFCSKCNSYYHFISETEFYFDFNAYPEKNIKKYHQNRMIRIQKKKTR